MVGNELSTRAVQTVCVFAGQCCAQNMATVALAALQCGFKKAGFLSLLLDLSLSLSLSEGRHKKCEK